ncbi:MAG: zinc-dependent alcohol dehydrogenase family protein [Burkholderiaceae bacterium]|nr:zinc-dependent alcohol dehydrogenase family protein [Burkholderiaceae bacterium]
MADRTIRFHEFGGPEVLRFESLDAGDPGQGELRVRIEAIGLNRAEASFRSGRYVEKAQLPSRIGYEAAGIVEAPGPGVQGFAPGDPVCILPTFSMTRYGVYAERAIVPAHSVLPRPHGLSAIESAAIWMAHLTAYGAIVDIARVGRGEAVIVTAASSSVGLAAIRICNAIGAIPIAVTRGEGKREALLRAGAAQVIVLQGNDLAAEAMRITGSGARLAFDSIGGPIVAELAAALAPQGLLILYGNLSGKARETPFPYGPALAKGLAMRGYLVFELIHDAKRFAAARGFIEEGLRAGALAPTIARTFEFDEMVEAHRYLESGEQFGKIVVTVPQEH